MEWTNAAGTRKFAYQDDPIFAIQRNEHYVGTNAVKHINLLPEWLPPGTAINIKQGDRFYSIYLISYTDLNEGEYVDIHQLLLDKGMIK